ncbi:hypothetical protein NU219Hw_g105t1 [Hortaea werneckii]
MFTTRQSSRKDKTTTNNKTGKKAPRHDFNFLALCPKLRNIIYTYAFSGNGPYYIEGLGIVTFHTNHQETSDGNNITVLSAAHALLCASKRILFETAALAFETIIDVGVRTRIDISMPYDRDLPIAVALQELPLRARTNLRHLHAEIANLNDLILWSLVSFAMLFVDEDYLLRPARVDA